MEDIIKIDTKDLSRDMNEVEAKLKFVIDKINMLKADVEELNLMWDGTEKKQFNNQFVNDLQSLLDMCGLISNIIAYEQTVQKRYDVCETEISSIIEQMKV